MRCFTEQKAARLNHVTLTWNAKAADADHQHSDTDWKRCVHHPPVNNQHRGHSSRDWQQDGCKTAVQRPASVAGNIATENGTPLTHPSTLEQFFGNAACSLIGGRRCSVTNKKHQ